MATIDQLLNDIDEFENWPLDSDEDSANPSDEVESDLNTGADLVESVLRGFIQ